jgi:hypothetical protein
VGQLVEVSVGDQSGPGRYRVRINGQPHSADSTSQLQAGSTVLAVVTGVGDRLELRAVSALEDPSLAQALSAMASRFRTDVPAALQRQIVLAAGASDAAIMTLRAGVYLSKLGQDVTSAALAALAQAQRTPGPATDAAAQGRENPVVSTAEARSAGNSAPLALLLERALAPQDGAGVGSGTLGFADSGGGKRQGQRHRRDFSAAAVGSNQAMAQTLLSLPDGGALHYRYATVPLLVNGKLMELDMALFHQPTPAVAAPRRLVMSLATHKLGAVRIVAHSLRRNLNISLASNSERGVTILSAAMGSMRDRLVALGWQIDTVRCQLARNIASAGSDIVDHVLNSGALDRAV